MFACENDFKAENIVFGPLKTLQAKVLQVSNKNKLALPFCCFLDVVANLLLYQSVNYRQIVYNR